MTVLGGLGGAAASRPSGGVAVRRIGDQRIGMDASLSSSLSGISVGRIGMDAQIVRRLKAATALIGLSAGLTGNISRLDASIGLDGSLASQATFTNGYSRMIEMAYSDPKATAENLNLVLRFDVTDDDLRTTGNGGFMENVSGHDVRIEDRVTGDAIPYERILYDGAVGRLVGTIRLAAQAAADVRRLRLFFGNAGASDLSSGSAVSTDYAARWVLPDLVDKVTGTRTLSLVAGRGASLPPSSANGLRAVFDGSVVLKLDDATFLDNLPSLTTTADVSQNNAVMNGADQGLLTVGALDGSVNSSPLVVGRLAQNTAGSAFNVWHYKVRDNEDNDNGFYLSQDGQAASVADAVITGVATLNNAPVFYVDGENLPAVSSGDYAGDVDVATTDPLYIGIAASSTGETTGVGWVGEIGEIRIRPSGLSANQAGIEGRNLANPSYTIAVSKSRSVTGSDLPVALTDLVLAVDGQPVEFNPLTNDLNLSGAVISAVTSPSSGSVTIVDGNTLRYTSDANFAGVDSFGYVVQIGNDFASGFVRVEVNANNGGNTGGNNNPEFRQLPPAVSTVNATPSNFVSVVESAAPGTHILVQPGTYNNREFTIDNADPDNPVVIRPSNPQAAESQQALFTGRTNMRGRNFQVFGCRFNNRATGGAGSRLINLLAAQNVVLAYLKLDAAGIGIEVIGDSTDNIILHRICGLNPENTGGNGNNFFKLGGGGAYRVDYNSRAEYCYCEGFRVGREAYSMKSNNWTVYRCRLVDCNDFAFRQCTGVTLEESRIDGTVGNRKIQVSGDDQRVINCAARVIELDTGSVDGDVAVADAQAGNARPSANDCILANCEATLGTEVGNVPFNDPAFDDFPCERNTLINMTGGVTQVSGRQFNTTIQTGVDPTYPVVEPTNLAASDTGLAAYVNNVTGA